MDVSNQFIDRLFHHPHFQSSLQYLWDGFQNQKQLNCSPEQNSLIQTVVEDISQALSLTFRSVVQEQCNHLYESNRHILEEIQNLRSQLKPSQNLKTQSSTAERETIPKLETSIFFETDSQYDMKQIRKHFDSEIENKILVNSFELDSTQQQRTILEQDIEEKINASVQGSINRIELTLEEKFENYSTKIQQRIEQLRKTIASVVQAMNEKQLWNQEIIKTQKQPIQSLSSKAFCKKQANQNQNQLQNDIQTRKNIQLKVKKQTIKMSVKNPQKQKQQSITQNSHLSSNKAIQSLNKSINLGRTKIKSFLGFKENTKKELKNQVA